MDRRTFTLGLLAATSIAGVSAPVSAQGAMAAAQYMAMATRGGMFLEETARSAYDKTQNPAVRRFARAEVVEQVSLSDKLSAVSGMAAAPAPGMAPGGVAGAVVGAPFAVAGAAVGAAGTVAGAVVGARGAAMGGAGAPMTSDAQKMEMIARFRDMQGGPEFDAAFVDAQLMGHREAWAIHGGYAAHGEDPALRRVARGALPLIRQHIATLTRMQRSMS